MGRSPLNPCVPGPYPHCRQGRGPRTTAPNLFYVTCCFPASYHQTEWCLPIPAGPAFQASGDGGATVRTRRVPGVSPMGAGPHGGHTGQSPGSRRGHPRSSEGSVRVTCSYIGSYNSSAPVPLSCLSGSLALPGLLLPGSLYLKPFNFTLLDSRAGPFSPDCIHGACWPGPLTRGRSSSPLRGITQRFCRVLCCGDKRATDRGPRRVRGKRGGAARSSPPSRGSASRPGWRGAGRTQS